MVGISDKWGFSGIGRWAHRGMLRAADTIRGDLEALGLLDRIFSAQQPYQLDGPLMRSAETPLLQVRVVYLTGTHSIHCLVKAHNFPCDSVSCRR